VATHGNALPRDYMLGEYRLVSVLGEGGFGITYQAEDSNLNCPVAIKEYLPTQLAKRLDDGTVVSLSDNHAQYFGDWKRRFLDEARTLARFRHPGIVRVLRFFEANGTAYLVMEMEQGITLEHYLRRLNRPPSQDELDTIVAPVLDGLEEVHGAGYLHRDIKPQNIVIRADGSPVLIDFGAARLEIEGRSRTLTSIYTPGYAAPEQYAEHGRLGPWTDIFALGAVLYRAVSGVKPMESLSRMMQASDPLLSAEQAAAPGAYRPAFLAGIDAALRLKPEERPQSVADWRPGLMPSALVAMRSVEAVAAVVMAESPTVVAPLPSWSVAAEIAPSPVETVAPPPPPIEITALPPSPVSGGSRRILWLSAAAGVVALSAATGLWWAGSSSPPPAASRAVVTAPTPAPVAVADAVPPPVATTPTPSAAAAPRSTSFRDCADCPDMVIVPRGSFMMGSPSQDSLHKEREEPQHAVTIAQPFALSRYHVTRQQFEAFARDTRLMTSGCQVYRKSGWAFDAKAGWHAPGFLQDDNHPVVCVSWSEAQAYVEWLSQKTGRAYRLPSEAEWEYAARGGSAEVRYWGAESQCAFANAADEATRSANPYLVAAACDDGFSHTAPVGSLKPNGFGLFDMLGNAGQWTQDCWHGNFKGAPSDGSAWADARCARRVVRGSAWSDAPEEVRAAVRYHESVSDHEAGVGFRVVRAPDP